MDVIPACFLRESRQASDWTPDPFDVAQGRGEHSRTTIEKFGGDEFGSRHHSGLSTPHSLLRRGSLKAPYEINGFIPELATISG